LVNEALPISNIVLAHVGLVFAILKQIRIVVLNVFKQKFFWLKLFDLDYLDLLFGLNYLIWIIRICLWAKIIPYASQRFAIPMLLLSDYYLLLMLKIKKIIALASNRAMTIK